MVLLSNSLLIFYYTCKLNDPVNIIIINIAELKINS